MSDDAALRRADALQSLDAVQYQALERILGGENVALLGDAGTGKSRLIMLAVEILRERYDRLARLSGGAARIVQVLAPTGRAASNAGGMTVHRFFNVMPEFDKVNGGMIFDGGWRKTLKQKPKLAVKLRMTKTLFIDEISMLGAEFFDMLSEMLQEVRKCPGRLFGGVQIVSIGDFRQLPPISKFSSSDERFTGDTRQFTFLARTWKPMYENSTILLKKNHRQSGDVDFAEMLRRISRSKQTRDDVRKLYDRCMEYGKVSSDVMHLYARNKDVDRRNADCMSQLKTTEYQIMGHVYHGKLDGDGVPVDLAATEPGATTAEGLKMESVQDLDELFATDWRLVLREGCRVLMVANVDVELGMCNGTTGTFVTMAADNAGMVLDLDMRDGTVQRATIEPWSFIWGRTPDGGCKVYKQYPVRLGYALTVHRAQGLTLHRVHIGGDFREPHQFYVALSRARTLEGVTLDMFNAAWIVTDGHVMAYYHALGDI